MDKILQSAYVFIEDPKAKEEADPLVALPAK